MMLIKMLSPHRMEKPWKLMISFIGSPTVYSSEILCNAMTIRSHTGKFRSLGFPPNVKQFQGRARKLSSFNLPSWEDSHILAVVPTYSFKMTHSRYKQVWIMLFCCATAHCSVLLGLETQQRTWITQCILTSLPNTWTQKSISNLKQHWTKPQMHKHTCT